MAVKKIGISRELIIHPGETIADILEDRGITQTELVARTGVSTAYVSNVIAGKKIFLQILLLVWNMRWEFQNLFGLICRLITMPNCWSLIKSKALQKKGVRENLKKILCQKGYLEWQITRLIHMY